MTNEYVIAHAVCPWCAADTGELCIGTIQAGVHAARHALLNLPTLDEIERGRRLREGLAALNITG
jgi:hypothetical protein